MNLSAEFNATTGFTLLSVSNNLVFQAAEYKAEYNIS